MQSIVSKTCSTCGEDKPLDQFSNNKRYIYGKYCKCKSCVREYYSAYYQANKEKRDEYTRRYYIENREAINKHVRVWYANTVDKRREYGRNYYVANRDRILEQKRMRYATKIQSN